jgi:hypothetical protein
VPRYLDSVLGAAGPGVHPPDHERSDLDPLEWTPPWR